jgi:hypothetical protein
VDFHWKIIQLANSDNSLMQERATNRLILSCRIGPVLNVTNLCCFLCQGNGIGWRFWHHAVISLWWGILACVLSLTTLLGETKLCVLFEKLYLKQSPSPWETRALWSKISIKGRNSHKVSLFSHLLSMEP